MTIGRELGYSPEVLAKGVEQNGLGRVEMSFCIATAKSSRCSTVRTIRTVPWRCRTRSIPACSATSSRGKRFALVFGAIAARNWRAMLKRLESVAGHRVFVAPPVRRAVDPYEMSAAYAGEVAEGVPRRAGASQAAGWPEGPSRRYRLDFPGRRGTRVPTEFAY